MEYITAKEAAGKWGISQRRVQVLCEQGRIQGAFRLGWAWAIPKDENKPSDARKMKTKIIRNGPVKISAVGKPTNFAV